MVRCGTQKRWIKDYVFDTIGLAAWSWAPAYKNKSELSKCNWNFFNKNLLYRYPEGVWVYVADVLRN